MVQPGWPTDFTPKASPDPRVPACCPEAAVGLRRKNPVITEHHLPCSQEEGSGRPETMRLKPLVRGRGSKVRQKHKVLVPSPYRVT